MSGVRNMVSFVLLVAGAACSSFGASDANRDPADAGTDDAAADAAADTDAGPNDGAVSDASSKRITEDLVALYTFREGAGETIKDVTTAATDLDLRLADVAGSVWTSDGLTLSGTYARTAGSAARITGCKAKGALSFEAWVRPSPSAQHGPARILSLAEHATSSNRIFLLGLGKDGSGTEDRASYVLRLGSGSSVEAYEAPDGTSTGAMQHLVATAKAGGTARLYVDGVPYAAFALPDSFGGWGAPPFLIGNDLALPSDQVERRFSGTYALVAVYCRELTADEVATNRAAGPRP